MNDMNINVTRKYQPGSVAQGLSRDARKRFGVLADRKDLKPSEAEELFRAAVDVMRWGLVAEFERQTVAEDHCAKREVWVMAHDKTLDFLS